MKKILYIVVISIIVSQFGYAQKLDSLWKIYNNTTQADTNRLKAINDIVWFYIYNNPDTALILQTQQLKLANSLPEGKDKWVAAVYNTMGIGYLNKGDFKKAADYFTKDIAIYTAIDNKAGAAFGYNNMGSIYLSEANYTKALESYLKSLKISEEINHKKLMGMGYSNIGLVYFYQKNYTKALEYHFKDLQLIETNSNRESDRGTCYINIGAAYQNMLDYTKALTYNLKALKCFEEFGNKRGIGVCYTNIGIVYKNQANYGKALEFSLKSLVIKKETEDEAGMGVCYGNIGDIYTKWTNYKMAVLYCDSELVLCKKIGDIDGEREAYEILATTYSKMNKYKEAYENHLKFKQLTDSIFNTDNSKQLGDLKTQFEVEKKEAELKIKADAEQEKLKAVANEENKRQQVIIASVVGVLLVVLVFSLFLYERFKITQRQKAVIEKQKILVDKAYDELHEKNKELMDSIRYAKRIQTALITSEKYIESSLNKLMKK